MVLSRTTDNLYLSKGAGDANRFYLDGQAGAEAGNVECNSLNVDQGWAQNLYMPPAGTQGKAFNKGRRPTSISITIRIISDTVATILDTYDKLVTVMNGDNLGYFQTYTHDSGGEVRYYDRCVANSISPLPEEYALDPMGGLYATVNISITCLIPAVQTSGTGTASNYTLTQRLDLADSAGASHFLIRDSGTNVIFDLDSTGDLSIKGELSEGAL